MEQYQIEKAIEMYAYYTGVPKEAITKLTYSSTFGITATVDATKVDRFITVGTVMGDKATYSDSFNPYALVMAYNEKLKFLTPIPVSCPLTLEDVKRLSNTYVNSKEPCPTGSTPAVSSPSSDPTKVALPNDYHLFRKALMTGGPKEIYSEKQSPGSFPLFVVLAVSSSLITYVFPHNESNPVYCTNWDAFWKRFANDRDSFYYWKK